MSDPLTKHMQRLSDLDKQKQACEEALKKEKSLELARVPIDITQYRNERNLMLFPFCSTAKRKRVKGIRYESADGKRWLEVTANHNYGMAKIWDFDILRFALSKAGEVALQVGYFPPQVEFSGYECLKALGRNPESGKNYKWLKEALPRLISTTYQGNVFRNDDATVDLFTLIKASYKDATGRLERVTITFDERLIESVRYFKGLLTINPDVLNEEAGIKKRLLELVAVSKGKESSWTVGLERLQAVCAHDGRLKEFKYQLGGYELPWAVSFSKAVGGGEKVTFRDKQIPHRSRPTTAP